MDAAPQMDMFASPLEELTWKSLLKEERTAPYFKSILEHIEKSRAAGEIIYPKNSEIFNAIHLTPFEKVKVVVIGQDPYHGPNQAHGLCFSVRPGIPKPPSLVNICRELSSDLGIAEPDHGSLENWTNQGVLLLNAVLSVEAGKPQSHSMIGWERFTDRIISVLNEKKDGLVFLLWGASAQNKGKVIDRSRHTVLKAPHPSPLSAHRGFFGCKHFSKTNEILRSQGMTEVNWSLCN